MEKGYSGNAGQNGHHVSRNQMPLGQVECNRLPYINNDGNEIVLNNHPNGLGNNGDKNPTSDIDDGFDKIKSASGFTELHERLSEIYEKVVVVDSIPAARRVVSLLTTEYKNLIHACDTEACIGFL